MGITVPEVLALGAERFPEAPVIITSEGLLSYGAYDEAVGWAVKRLTEIGVRTGERVAVAGHVDGGYVIALMALLRMGAVACLLNTRWPAKAMSEALQRVGGITGLLSDGLSLPGISTVSFGDVQGKRGKGEEGKREIPVDQPATIMFTSGSAGPPKAALHSYGNHYFNAYASNRNIPVVPGDRWLLSLPLYHVAGTGILFRCMAGGGAVVLPVPEEPIEEAIRRHGVTHLSLVSTQLHRLLQSDSAVAALRGLKAILLGGGPVPGQLIREASAQDLTIHTSYGLTEMASQVTTTRRGDPLDRLLTSGRPLEPGSIAIASDGEILVRGNSLFLGYLGEGRVNRPLTPERWFATGDIGNLDDDGCLTICGRNDNMFISGGENIQPEEIEQCLCQIPHIVRAVVVPVPHPEFGAVPVAFLEADATPDVRSIRKALAEGLPRFKIPWRFHDWPKEWSRSDAKVSRAAMAEMARNLSAEE